MRRDIPPAGTDTGSGKPFSRPWYDYFLRLSELIAGIQGGNLPPGVVPTGSILFTQSNVVLGRSSAGAGAGEELAFTEQAQQLADDTSFAQMRNTLGLELGVDVQEWDETLQDLSDVALVEGDILYFDGTDLTNLGIGTAGQGLKVNAGATAPEWGDLAPEGYYEPLTTGDHAAPELVFVDGDVVMVFVPL